jgi:pimeloyl-ACP methyl ester carboxylesterase
VDLRDLTTFDRHVRNPREGSRWLGVVVQNPTPNDLYDLRFAGAGVDETKIPVIPAMSARKVPLSLRAPRPGVTPPKTIQVELRRGRSAVQKFNVSIETKPDGASFRRTFISAIDGSVQYFAVNPAPDASRREATILSLHGASVEAIGQAQAYGPKEWADIVCPTNRRPFGFDWEDIGRKDALEVLGIAQIPGRPVVLTGHSMGGHGTWNVAANTPGVFSAIAPCAGWESFASYAGGMAYPAQDPVGRILQRASATSQTLSLKDNYRETPVFIVHGAADDVVPPTEARRMRDELRGIAPELTLHEEPGQGHWYDLDPAPGADSVDFPPMMRWLRSKAKPIPTRTAWRAVTLNPSVSSLKEFGVEVVQPERPLQLSVVEGKWTGRELALTTQNVQRLRLMPSLARPERLLVDGVLVAPGRDYAKSRGRWIATVPAPAQDKGPQRFGPWKEVLDRRVQFVYATGGDADHNAWARAKAVYDSEQFWYRGNGAADVFSDVEWLRQRDRTTRNVVLYGRADTHRAWTKLVVDSPVTVTKGEVRVGTDAASGADLVAVFLRPMPGNDRALVGVVAPTGPAGERLSNRVPVYTPGASFPDWLVLGGSLLTEGLGGIRGAGFFGNDWRLSGADSAWRR